MLRTVLCGTRRSSPTTRRSTRWASEPMIAWASSRARPWPGAAVRAVAEGEVVDGVALDQERVGVLVVARVAVAGAEEDRDLRAGRHEGAVDLDVAGDPAAPGVQRVPSSGGPR